MSLKRSHGLIGLVGAAVLLGGLGGVRPALAVDAFLGQIQYFPYNFAPRSWAFCNGQLLPISQNTALFSLLGTIYGGDGRTTFALPDMRGRAPLHQGRGPGLSNYVIGQRSGVERVTLSANQLPSHTHTLQGTNSLGNQASPSGGALSRDGRDQTYSNTAPDTNMAAGSIANAGGGQSHDNMPPFLTLNCNIALQGIYPSPS